MVELILFKKNKLHLIEQFLGLVEEGKGNLVYYSIRKLREVCGHSSDYILFGVDDESIDKIQNVFKVDPETGVSVISSLNDKTYFNTTYSSMRFVSNDNETMVINGETSTIEIEKAMINSLNMGDFRWEVQSDQSLILKEGVLIGNNSNQ